LKSSRNEIGRVGKAFQIIINRDIFDMSLFKLLLAIRDLIMDLNFDIKNERIRRIIEDHRLTISKIKGEIGDYE